MTDKLVSIVPEGNSSSFPPRFHVHFLSFPFRAYREEMGNENALLERWVTEITAIGAAITRETRVGLNQRPGHSRPRS